MRTAYEIQLTPQAQFFKITLGGIVYNMTLSWNVFGVVWELDIADNTGAIILSSIPLVANVDLLLPYKYMNFGGQLVAQTDSDITIPPTYDNLGSTGHLYFITN